MEEIELSIVLPCRNEEQAIGGCIRQIKEVVARLSPKKLLNFPMQPLINLVF